MLFQIANYFKGRYRQVYMPTLQNDLIVAQASLDNLTIRSEPTDYPRTVLSGAKQKTHVQIVYTNGDVEYRAIESATAETGYDLFTLDSPLTNAITLTNINRISFMKLVRGNTDEPSIEIRNLTSAILTFELIEIA